MEYAVYRIFRDERGRKLGSYVEMFASREEAETHARGLGEGHEAVGLWTREVSEEDAYLFERVVFLPNGIVAPEPETGEGEE